MQAGSLNKRVRFYSLQRVDDGAGGATEKWLEVASVWAQFSPERGRERLQVGRVAGSMLGVLRIRSSTQARAITIDHRVVLEGQTYNITAILNPDQRNVMLEMTLDNVIPASA